MTKQTEEALKMAIEAWDRIDTTNQSNLECARQWFIEGYVQALEQPAQEPVAWLLEYRDGEFDYWHKNCDEDKLALEMWFDAIRYDTTEHKIYPLYTHPAPSWQGLSDDEKLAIIRKWKDAHTMREQELIGLGDAFEQALRIKNAL